MPIRTALSPSGAGKAVSTAMIVPPSPAPRPAPATASRMWALDPATYLPPLYDRHDPAHRVHRVPFPIYLIEHAEGLVLFDAGLAPEAAGDPVSVYGDMAARLDFEFTEDQQIEHQLAGYGFALADVTHVIASHLHFDHCGALKLFPHAITYLGAGEMEYARAPEKFCRGWYRAEDFDPAYGIDFHELPCDHDVFGDGAVTVLHLPGHSPGSLGALVRLPHRTIMISGDAVHHRVDLENEQAYRGDHDTVTARASLRKMIHLAALHDADVWINHDPQDWADFGGAGLVH